MLEAKDISQLLQRALDRLPEGAISLPQDLRNNLHEALQAVVAKADVVSREEFDAQCALLARTQQQLEQLKQRLSELEAQNTKQS